MTVSHTSCPEDLNDMDYPSLIGVLLCSNSNELHKKIVQSDRKVIKYIKFKVFVNSSCIKFFYRLLQNSTTEKMNIEWTPLAARKTTRHIECKHHFDQNANINIFSFILRFTTLILTVFVKVYT